MPFDYDQFYSPWARRRREAAASPENPATTGVPNPARSDPYPRFDPDAPARRALGAIAYGEMSGSEPRTAAELEEASGVDRRIPDAPNSFGPVRRGAAGSRLVEGTGGAYGYTNGSVEGLYRYGTRTAPAPGGLAGALLSSGRAGVSPEEAAKRWEDLQLEGHARNRNNSYYEQSYGTAAAEDAIARGRLKVPTLAMEAARGTDPYEFAREAAAEQQARIFGRRQEYLGERAGDNSLAYHERLGLGAMRSAEAEEAATRRREAEAARMADAELAAQTERARIAAGVPVSFGGGAGAIPNADGGWDYQSPPPGTTGAAADNSWRTEVARIEQETQIRVKELENQGLDRRQAEEIAARERIQKLQNAGNLDVAKAQSQGRTDAATATAQGRVGAATATAQGRVDAATATAQGRTAAAAEQGKWRAEVQRLENEGRLSAEQARAAGRVEEAGIRADAQKYASDNSYRAAADASTARVEAAKAAGLSDQEVARIRTQSEERIAKLSQDGALARAGIQADAQKYIADNRYAAAADAAAAAVEAAKATADARVSAERVRAEGARLLAAENPWVALGGGVMGNRQTGDQAGRPNATAAASKPQIFKMKGADGTERLVRPREDGSGVEVLFEDPDAALVIAEQEVRNLESDKLRYGRTTAQREGYDERIAEAKARLAALREARRSAPDYEGPTGQAPTNDAADGWAAFGGIVR